MEQTKGNADIENNADWILDSLVAYLRGPIWITPILNFMEQKSVGIIKTDFYQHPIIVFHSCNVHIGYDVIWFVSMFVVNQQL